MIEVLIAAAVLLTSMLLLVQFERYWVRSRILPRLVRRGFCETCLGRSFRGENEDETQMTLRAEAFYGLIYLFFAPLGEAWMDRLVDEVLRRMRAEPGEWWSFTRMQHPDCHRGRCACGIPHCDGHMPDELVGPPPDGKDAP